MTYRAIAVALLISAISFAQSTPTCLTILSPRPTVCISQNRCTLTVATCPEVVSVTAAIQYTGSDGISQKAITIGTSERAPFSILINLDTIPDQLVTGMAIIAQAMLSSGSTVSARCEGIFLLKSSAPPPTLSVGSNSGAGRLSKSEITLNGTSKAMKAGARLAWDTRNLFFDIAVVDPSFTTTLPDDQQAAMGVEILLDPSKQLHPYPDDSVTAWDVPLFGKPSRRFYKPVFTGNDGYKLTVQLKKTELPVSIETVTGKGWRIRGKLPATVRLKTGDTIRCNIVVKPLPGAEAESRITWAASGTATYAPVAWGTLVLTGGGFFTGGPFIWIVSFILSFSVALLAGAATILTRRKLRTMSMRQTGDAPEEHRATLDKIRSFMESHVTDRTASIDSAAAELALPAAVVNRLCKRHFGWQFQHCLMLSRTEVARERLRSSNAPEKSIAAMCGFADESEMEKCFIKFYHTTPDKYRQEQQVT